LDDAFDIRHARQSDEVAITTLVRSERLNPTNLDWRRFILAMDGSGLLGAVQLRLHPDRSRELGSLVVRPDARGRGIAARMIDALLAPVGTRVLMITGAAFARHYARWGFRRIPTAKAPLAIQRNYHFGRLIGGVLSLMAGRRPRELAILDREAPTRAR
jgi:N-acetylglutamate synthase-like GNAT family acetyltransferase